MSKIYGHLKALEISFQSRAIPSLYLKPFRNGKRKRLLGSKFLFTKREENDQYFHLLLEWIFDLLLCFISPLLNELSYKNGIALI